MQKMKKEKGTVQESEITRRSESLVSALKRMDMTITTVESCTGGMVSAAITSVAGSSSVFQRGFVTYCDKAKHDLVGVKKKTLCKYTAVSRQTAKEMADGGAGKAKADICVSVTGYAGPASGEEEVGLVYVGCCCCGKTKVKKFHFEGDRSEVRLAACAAALAMAGKALKKMEQQTVQVSHGKSLS